MTNSDYNKCVDLYSDCVFRFIVKSINDNDKANDIVQDTYEKLWIHHYNVDFMKAKSYIFSTAYHTMIDMIRKDKRTTLLDSENELEYTHDEQYSDLQEILHAAIQKLPESQRIAVLLRDYEGYSYSEISEITNLSESQVKVYIYRARLFLKSFIGKPEMVI